MEGTFNKDDDSQTFRMELKNLKVEKQGPSLFEIPDGYKKFEMPAFPGFGRNQGRWGGSKPR